MHLFNRVVKLSIGNIDISDLHVSFVIEKTLFLEPNTCELTVYNLSADNRKRLSDLQKVPVVVKAGYGDNIGLLFHGDLLALEHIKSGPDWKTNLRSGDGALPLQEARINKAYGAGTPIMDILKDIAHSLGISVGNALNELQKYVRGTLPRGASLSGNSGNELVNIIKGFGLQASIQDGALQVLSFDKAHGEAIELNAHSGLVETSTSHASNPNIRWLIFLRTLLMPELLPGRLIKVKDNTHFHRIEKVRYTGGNFGKDWFADIEARRV